ncbi:permease [Kineococcus sp. NBC_00420]|uniref:permease n=1 Tax=Kineococcus sp. NBC_00420 TaxID=2903564 RepID=UPI003FA549A9
MDSALNAVGDALRVTGSMAWQIGWALILGFALSAIVQAVVRRDAITRLLGDARPRTLLTASGLGIASSSCSYAAAALARSLFRKGADFTAAIAFQVASTNLVIELGIILTLLMGWQFAAAEYSGGIIMIVVVALLFRLLMRPNVVDGAREEAEQGRAGSMEGHAAMDMSAGGDASWWRRLLSGPGFTAVSQVFVMEWAAVLRDILIGLFIAGALDAWVPKTFWQAFFLIDHPVLAQFWGPLVAPLVAVASFVCSVGNVPLAAVLWNGGISFGGVVSFLFADLIILPIVVIYRKYYGGRVALRLAGVLYVASVVAGYVVELAFGLTGLVPAQRNAVVQSVDLSWNYTTVLDIVFALLAIVLVLRFLRTGGREMLSMMGGQPDHDDDQQHQQHQQHQQKGGASS